MVRVHGKEHRCCGGKDSGALRERGCERVLWVMMVVPRVDMDKAKGNPGF